MGCISLKLIDLALISEGSVPLYVHGSVAACKLDKLMAGLLHIVVRWMDFYHIGNE